MKMLVLIFSLLSSQLNAEELKIATPRDIYVDVYNNQTVHDPYIYPADEQLGYGANFNLDFNIVKYGSYSLYWNNLLHFDQSKETGKVVHGGWQFELGIPVYVVDNNPKIELFHQHHSRHVLDAKRDSHFPVYDRAGIRFRIYP